MDNLAVILAGGKGTRMKRNNNKVLELICGKPLIKYLIDGLKEINIKQIFVVVGFDAENVKKVVGEEVKFVYQKEQLGTGDALRLACEEFKNFTGNVLLLNGDGPILNKDTLLSLCDLGKSDFKVLTGSVDKASSFGRIKRNKKGQVVKIIEARDCTEKELEIQEANYGVYCFKNTVLQRFIANLSRNNAQNEYYVTDLVEIFSNNHYIVTTQNIESEDCFMGVNTLREVDRLERKMQFKINQKLTNIGIRLIDINNTYIDATVSFEGGGIIYPNVHLVGNTKIGSNCVIEPNCYLKDVIVADGVSIGANSVIINTQIENNVNPMSYINKVY